MTTTETILAIVACMGLLTSIVLATATSNLSDALRVKMKKRAKRDSHMTVGIDLDDNASPALDAIHGKLEVVQTKAEAVRGVLTSLTADTEQMPTINFIYPAYPNIEAIDGKQWTPDEIAAARIVGDLAYQSERTTGVALLLDQALNRIERLHAIERKEITKP